MKKLTLTPPRETVIDWSKPQWVIHRSGDIVVLTTGETEIDIFFTGTAIPCKLYPTGILKYDWDKNEFYRLTHTIDFQISNED